PALGGEAGIEAVVHALCRKDRDCLLRQRQVGVESVTDIAVGERRRQVEVADLVQRMYAGIGSTGTFQGDFLAAQGEDRALDRFLDGGLAGLPLPASIARTVILDVDAITGHSGRLQGDAHARRCPLAMAAPRRKSAAVTTLPPARWSSSS